LEAADSSSRTGDPDLAAMVALLEAYLTKQLQAVLAAATQTGGDADSARKFH
jgi:hypothetical protein